MSTLIKRHTILFLKDKTSVCFSLLSVFTIVALYLLFLSHHISSNVPHFEDRSSFGVLWMFAVIIAVTTAHAALGALGKFIEDKVSKIKDDFLITKITQQTLSYSYIIYTFVIGLFFTVLLLLFGYIYTFMTFDEAFIIFLQLIIVVLFSTLMHTLLFYFIISILNKMKSFSEYLS